MSDPRTRDAALGIGARIDRLPSACAIWKMLALPSLGGVFEFYDLFFTAYVAPGMVSTGLRPENRLHRILALVRRLHGRQYTSSS